VSTPPPPPPPPRMFDPEAGYEHTCARCGYRADQHGPGAACPDSGIRFGPPRPARSGMPAGLVALLTIAAILVILFVVYRFYIDTHCTMVLGTQVCSS
jgi:hypothetical protein